MCIRAPLATLSLLPLLAGCVSSGLAPTSTPTAPCPDAIQTAVRVTASVAPVQLPGAAEASSPVKRIAGAGRRILFSVEVPASVPRARLIANSLSVHTFGGTLSGWARVVHPIGAASRESIAVSSGYLRISPFLPGARLHSQSQTIDLQVIPGGEPVGQLAFQPGALWDPTGRATPANALEFSLEPIVHMTVLEAVDATVEFDFTVLGHSRKRWVCSAQSDFQLVDHDSVLPDLWELREPEAGGSDRAVALSDAHAGPFPLVFLDPAIAEGFARWLRETQAAHVAHYEIGLLSTKVAGGFQVIPSIGLPDLVVKQFGSDPVPSASRLRHPEPSSRAQTGP